MPKFELDHLDLNTHLGKTVRHISKKHCFLLRDIFEVGQAIVMDTFEEEMLEQPDSYLFALNLSPSSNLWLVYRRRVALDKEFLYITSERDTITEELMLDRNNCGTYAEKRISGIAPLTGTRFTLVDDRSKYIRNEDLTQAQYESVLCDMIAPHLGTPHPLGD